MLTVLAELGLGHVTLVVNGIWSAHALVLLPVNLLVLHRRLNPQQSGVLLPRAHSAKVFRFFIVDLVGEKPVDRATLEPAWIQERRIVLGLQEVGNSELFNFDVHHRKLASFLRGHELIFLVLVSDVLGLNWRILKHAHSRVGQVHARRLQDMDVIKVRWLRLVVPLWIRWWVLYLISFKFWFLKEVGWNWSHFSIQTKRLLTHVWHSVRHSIADVFFCIRVREILIPFLVEVVVIVMKTKFAPDKLVGSLVDVES